MWPPWPSSAQYCRTWSGGAAPRCRSAAGTSSVRAGPRAGEGLTPDICIHHPLPGLDCPPSLSGPLSHPADLRLQCPPPHQPATCRPAQTPSPVSSGARWMPGDFSPCCRDGGTSTRDPGQQEALQPELLLARPAAEASPPSTRHAGGVSATWRGMRGAHHAEPQGPPSPSCLLSVARREPGEAPTAARDPRLEGQSPLQCCPSAPAAEAQDRRHSRGPRPRAQSGLPGPLPSLLVGPGVALISGAPASGTFSPGPDSSVSRAGPWSPGPAVHCPSATDLRVPSLAAEGPPLAPL